MISTLLVGSNVSVLRKQLAKHCSEVKILAEAGSVDEAIRKISQYHPRLVFLDVEMTGKNGFNLLRKYKERDFQVILVASHSDFALKAFRFSVTDYLLKPVNTDRLKQAIGKLDRLKDLSLADDTNRQRQTLRFSSKDGFVFTHFRDIIRLKANGNYTHFYLSNRQHYFSSYHIQKFEEFLDHNLFIRVHRSHIINYQKIRRVIQKPRLLVEMSDGYNIEVPRRRREEFLETLQLKKWQSDYRHTLS